MPIVIDEVVIAVEVTNSQSGGGAPPAPLADRQAIVQETVERVLDILRQREEP